MIGLSYTGGLEYGWVLYFSIYELILLLVLSFVISLILHFSISKKNYSISAEEGVQVVEIKNYSFLVKTITLFIVLVMLFMPIFKLMGIHYFL